jgi:AcrR family transcriptional regulator
LRPDRYSAIQRRTIEAAMELFAEHGVSGTSFKMIADALGVTKAAVYHQFKSKEALVTAVAEVGLVPLEAALAAVEDVTPTERARELLLAYVIDLAVSRRRWAGALLRDPGMHRFLNSYPPYVELTERVYALLLGLEPGPAVRIRTAIVADAIGAAVSHPLVIDVDDATLRVELMVLCRGLFHIGD